MSLQKVVSNYYVDLLDFLNTQYRNNNGSLDTYFNKTTPELRKKFINKLGVMQQRIELLQGVQDKFWDSRIRNNTAYVWILVSMLIVTFVVLGVLCVQDLADSINGYYTFKKICIYGLALTVMSGIFIVMLVNISLNRAQARQLKEEAATNLVRMNKMFDLKEDTKKMLVFVGYLSSGSFKRAQSVYNDNTNILKDYVIFPGEDTGSDKVIKDTTKFDYEKFFTTYRQELLTAVTNLYEGGLGYETIRKEMVSSSNMLIIKEFNRIMEYYYKLLKRKNNAEALTDAKKINDTLDKFVVKDISLVSKVMSPGSKKPYVDKKDKMESQDPAADVKLNEEDKAFTAEFNNLLWCYAYMTVYMYQIHVKKTVKDPTFDSGIKAIMPQNINLALESTNLDFYNLVKLFFDVHANNEIEGIVQLASTAATIDTIYTNTMLQLKEIVDQMYQTVMINLKGDYQFPFDGTHLEPKIKAVLADKAFNKGSVLDSAYSDMMVKKICTELVPKCEKTYTSRNSLEFKKAAIVSRLAANIEKFEIKLVEHSTYIIGKVQEGGKIDGDIQALMLEMLSAVDRDVAGKKAARASSAGKKANDNRFLDLDQFIEALDKISYNDLKVGLNYGFFGEILDRFYFSVSDAIYSGEDGGNKKSRDIYFSTEKMFKVAITAIWFLIIAIVFGLSYHLTGITEHMTYASMAKASTFLNKDGSEKDMDPAKKKELRTEFRNDYTNTIIKGTVPVVVAVFFICLLWSIYKKNKAKFNFNKEVIDQNTAELRTSVTDLRVLIEDIDSKVAAGQRVQAIKNIGQVGIEEKTKMYKLLKTIVDRYEKCNYVLASRKNDIPFPYTEVIVDGFMITAIVFCIVYVIGTIGPLERIKEIKALYRLKEQSSFQDEDPDFQSKLTSKASCHDVSIDSIVFTLKIIFFMFIILFLVFYSTKVLSSTTEFEYGIYNSSYFEDSSCIE